MAQRKHSNQISHGGAVCALVFLALGGAASAQTMTTNSSSYNGGWGRVGGSENQAVGVALVSRDANGNREITNGIMQTGAQTVSARADAAGSASAGFSGGVGSSSGSALAVGNSLTVITTGNYNTVIVDSTQINNGDISANVSGGVGQ